MLTFLENKTVPDLPDQGLHALAITNSLAIKGVYFIMTQNTESLQPKYSGDIIVRKRLSVETGRKWSRESFYTMLAKMGYVEKINEDSQWQPTKKAEPFVNFRNGVIKWNTAFVDLILQQLPKQLTLDI
ncbi:hypothetical protein [Anabaena sp. UHCC 0451]|uniref:hypothetical protein n=1 Tax=Anabaena sp. UHCC 0451 TaxID=2055235 RepID=UPI002B20A945|nr:hypothetical protein [Anabaena sp. UHCC 0451]MEA5578535.1 hypothetical protein [Anabaena sp. UHCC 0451]